MSASAKTRVQRFGAVILVAGWAMAAWIWLGQDRLERQSDDQGSLLDSRKAVRQLEVYYGQSGVVFQQWTEWLNSLFHGKRLALLIAAVSTVLGLVCLLAADGILAFIAALQGPGESPPPSQS